MSELVLVERERSDDGAGLAVVTLNRPEALNALSQALRNRIAEVFVPTMIVVAGFVGLGWWLFGASRFLPTTDPIASSETAFVAASDPAASGSHSTLDACESVNRLHSVFSYK